MKKIIIALFGLSYNLFGQFSVSGQFENYINKPVLVKIYESAESRLIKNVKTDPIGNFSVQIPKEYYGMVNIILPTGENISLLTDNKDIKFKTVTGKEFLEKVDIIEGNTAKEYKKLSNNLSLNEVGDKIIPYLMQMYNSKDEFYIALDKEKKRIDNLSKDNGKKSGLVTYVNDLNILKQKSQTEKNSEITNEIITHFMNDDERLEQSGFFNDLVFAYINTKLEQEGSQDIENSLISVTDDLMTKTDIQTARGQNILATILHFIPQKDYPNFHKKYKDKVNKLTCKVTEQLKKHIVDSNIKVGEKVPNITFDKAINGKKSLYDIKANQKLILFWASWCPACRQEMAYIKEFYKEFKTKGGEIVAISLDYDQNDFNTATKDLSWYNYTDLLRWDSPLVETFQIDSTPTLLLIDKDNKLIKKVNHISELEK